MARFDVRSGGGTKTHDRSAVAAALVCGLLLTGCSAAPAVVGAPTHSAPGTSTASPAVPLPSPTGTWTTPPTDAPEGPKTAAPLPTERGELDEPIALSTGVTVEVTSVKATTVSAETPGEISGPAVIVDLSVTNDSNAAVNVDSAVVNLTADKGGYGVGTTAGRPLPLAGNIEPGDSREGRYVFMLDPAKGRSITVSVNYGAGEPVAVFTGKSS